jgi:phosphatidylinositol alpha-1,6-mannosyltransferase
VSGARAGVYLHGLDVVVDDRAYRAIWWPLIRRCDFALCNSRNTAKLAVARGFPPDRIDVLEPGVSLPDPDARAPDYRAQAGLGERPVIVSVGRLTARKGLPEFIEQAWPSLLARRPDAVLIIVGGEPADALAPGRGGVAERIGDAVRMLGAEESVRALGRCDDDALRAILAAADVQVFPVLDLPGDVEGFGMVAVEAAAAGIPTVGFAVGGVPEAIADGMSGSVVAAGDYAGLVASLVEWIDRRRSAPAAVSQACREHAARHAWPRFGDRLREIVRRRTMPA